MGTHDGKLFVVGGGEGGVGKTVYEVLREEGASVLSLDLKLGDNLSSRDETGSVFSRLERENTRIDGYVSLVYAGSGDTGILDVEPEEIEREHRGTFLAAFYPVQRAVKSMIATGGGNVVVVSSVNSVLGLNEFAYDAAKGAVNAIARDLAVAHGKDGIYAVTLCPGTICGTPSWDGKEADLERIRNWIPDRKVTTAEEVARSISFFLTEWGRMFSGSTIVCDRGWHLRPIFKM